MASVEITIDKDKLQHLFGSSDGFRHIIEQAVNKMLKVEMSEHLRADPSERSDERMGYRNGHYSRSITTRVGTLHLEVPRDREGTFRTELFERFQRSEQALVLSMMDMVVQGVSTRKVKHITQILCGREFSKSTVSQLCKGLDEQVNAFLNRGLNDVAYPFVIADAMYCKVRHNGRVRSTAVLMAVGINEEGYREILGLEVSMKESTQSWGTFFARLRERGLSGIDFITTDQHLGLVAALREHFPGATWQRCQAHFIRNVMDSVRPEAKEKVMALLKQVLYSESPETARRAQEHFREELELIAPKAVAQLEEAFEDVTAVLSLPEKYRRRLRTSNMMERQIEEVRRRERVIRIFPNEASARRLIGALLNERHEAWMSGRLYLNMQTYNDYKTKQDILDQAAAAA